jgi:hypothetical protein
MVSSLLSFSLTGNLLLNTQLSRRRPYGSVLGQDGQSVWGAQQFRFMEQVRLELLLCLKPMDLVLPVMSAFFLPDQVCGCGYLFGSGLNWGLAIHHYVLPLRLFVKQICRCL